VVELVDTLVLEASAARRSCSSQLEGTTIKNAPSMPSQAELEMNLRRNEILFRYGGLFVFLVCCLLGIIRVLRQAVPGHYRVFTGAARMLWEQMNPHGTDFGTGVGYWFYSPTCGLFFFKFFDLFPEKIGLTLYSLLSVAALIIGIEKFLDALFRTSLNFCNEKKIIFSQTLYLILSPILLLGVTTSKPEIIMTGLLLWSLSAVMENRHIIFGSAVLAMLLNWKYQPLPTLGLLSVAWVFSHRNLKLPLLLLFFSFLWFFAPLTVLSIENLKEIYSSLSSTFSSFIEDAWMNFDNIFSFIVHGLHWNLSHRMTQVLSILIGGIFALGLVVLHLKKKRGNTPFSFAEGVLYSMGFGSLFTVTLSPLSQNNSYTLLTPFFIYSAYLILKENSTEPGKGKILRNSFIGLIFILFLAYSDLNPKPIRDFSRSIGLKPLALFVFGWFIYVREVFFKRPYHPAERPND
jgi:hypothetical protein